MKNIVVVGSLNMDINLLVPHIPSVGETILANEVSYFRGGKGANQATAIARLGGSVVMIGAVGNDSHGKQLLNGLVSEGIETDGILIKDGYSTGFAVVCVSLDGNNNIIVSPGTNHKILKDDIDRFKDIILQADFCVLQLEIPENIVNYVIDICFENNTKVILNPAPAIYHFNDETLKKIDYLIPNETELSIIADTSVNNNNIEEICQGLIRKGCKNVIVTMGDKGSLWINDKCARYYPAEKVAAIDTTAAGDSFIGGFTYMLANGKSIDDAIKFATKAAAITVTRRGAQESLPTLDDVMEQGGKS